MSSIEVHSLIERHVQGVGLALYEGVAAGVDHATVAMGRLSIGDYPWLFSGHARAAMRHYWVRSGHLGVSGWSVRGRPQLMGETFLENDEHRLSLRLLKESGRVHPGGVPAAGRSDTRREQWQAPLPGLARSSDGLEFLSGVAACLLLWAVEFEAGIPLISVRVVHPLEPGRYGQRVPIDMSFSISPKGQMFEDLRFSGDPQEEDLFPNILEQENEDGLGG
ncbi:MAG: hypothetical protein QM286_13105 [Acidobacteriota bacterium]|nr:hypothetical protein [Acidobacteriota bacterium]